MTELSRLPQPDEPPAHEPRDAADQRTGRRTRAVDVLVVGGGPGGLSCAAELARAKVGTVEVVERENTAGGIPRHSDHIGFGLRDLHRVLPGSAYAERTVDAAASAGAVVRTGTTVTDWSGPLTVDITSAAGLERVTARAVVLATGARERPRSARLIPGDRPPDGIFTTGHLQQAAAAGQDLGARAVVVGAEHVSYSAAVTLERAGVRVVAMVTHLPKQQSYLAFAAAAKLRYRFPVLCDAHVSWIAGRDRLEAVVLRRADGRVRRIAADTLVLTGDWIPDHELARRGGLLMDRGTRGPSVDARSATSELGVFATGNLVHPVETADAVAVEGRSTARSVLEYLQQLVAEPAPIGSEAQPAATVIRVEPPLRWVVPNLVAADRTLLPDRRRMTIWADDFASRPVLDISQGTRQLTRVPLGRTVVPNRPYRVLADWMANVRRGGEDAVTIRLV